MDIKDYIPARIAALRARQQELVKENEIITFRIDELLRMTQPAEEVPDVSASTAKNKRVNRSK